MPTVAVFLEHEVPVFRPDDAQLARFADRLGPSWRVVSARTEAGFLELLPEADAADVWTFRQAWFAQAPRLRWLCTPAAGRDYFRVVPPPGVERVYGGFHGAIMGETAAGCVLALAHGILPFAQAMRGEGSAAWPRPALAARARRLAGASVVILGFGRIGRAAARFLAPFGPRLSGIARSVCPPPPDLPGVETGGAADLDRFLPRADFLLLFLPSGAETDGLLDARRLALLPPGAFLLNFGRGNAVDEAALAAALRSGHLAGAVLDVFRDEPLPASSPLRGAPNAWLFPHSSAFSPDYLDLHFEELAGRLLSAPLPLPPLATPPEP